jgi:hypothetical protein
MTVFRCQEIPTRSEAFFYPGPPCHEAFKDGFLPFDRNEVRSRRVLGEFFNESPATPWIVVNTAEDPH